jgi:DNA-binding NarL/FixJ family response regulator
VDISDFPVIIEELPIAVVVVDGDGEVVIANRAARRHTACPTASRPVKQQAVDHALREIGTGRPLAVEESPLGRALAGQVVRGFEYLLRWPGSAEDVWMAVDACPLTDGEGRVRGAIAVIADTPRPGSPGQRPGSSLSGREEEVLRFLAGGQTNRQIAAALGVSENTVKKYVSGLLYRHRLSRRSEAAAFLRLRDRSPTHGRLAVRESDLSEQERRILRQIAQGKTNQEIALALALSPHTIKTYVSVIFQKLHVTRRAEAAAVAIGLLPPPDEA